MSNSTNRNRFQYAATLLGALAIAAMAPAAIANATNDQNEDPAGPNGCHHTDKDGHDIPIFDGSDVFVDGTIVSCRGGKITITTAPKTGAANAQTQQVPGSVLSPVNETPKKSPVIRNVPVATAKN